MAALAPLSAVAAEAAPADAPKAAEAPKPAPKPASITVTPYGTVHLGIYESTQGFNSRDFVNQAQPTSANDAGSLFFTARASRLGLKAATTEEIWGAKIAAMVEADFRGGPTPSLATANTTTGAVSGFGTTSASAISAYLLRLRHANLKATWKTDSGDFTVVAGQDWALVAPLAPVSATYLGDQVFDKSGNLNRRAPQLKLVYDNSFDAIGLKIEAAILNPADEGSPADFGFGNKSRRPDVEGRLALAYKMDGKKMAEVGVGYHNNTRRQNLSDTNKDLTVSAIALDAVFNLPYVTIQGEYFSGSGIDPVYAGFAGATVPSVPVTSTSTPASALTTLDTSGYWFQIDVKPVDGLDLVFGLGAETPNADQIVGQAVRAKNATIGGGIIVTPHKAWKMGLEVYQTTSDVNKVDAAKKTTTTSDSALQISLGTSFSF